MPAVRTAKSASPPAFDSLHYADFVPSNMPQSYEPLPPSPNQKKKRSHGKARPPGHIPRPPNAFIIFRTDQIKAMETQNSTPEVSKSLGEMWRQMSLEERQPYIERANNAKIEHQQRYPDYKYKPIHPRDEFGNCIRKPRNPNRPRVNRKLVDEEQFGEPLSWLEGSTAVGNGPSDLLPPSTPSLPPSTPAQPQSNFLSYTIPRRPSSVPLPVPTNTTWGEFSQATFTGLGAQMGYYPSRRLSKRPSTSMDFVNMPASHFIQAPYALSNALGDQFPLQNKQQQQQLPHHSTQWHMGHRRSLSAPNFGEFEAAVAQFSHYPTFSNLPTAEANSLAPINPVFNSMFSNFTWPTDNQSSQHTALSSITPRIQIPKVPPMSSTQDSPNQTGFQNPVYNTTQSPGRVIHHPAPVTTLNTFAFQNQVKHLETAAGTFEGLIAGAEHVGFDNTLGLSVPLDAWSQQPQGQQQATGYVDHQNNTQTHTAHQILQPHALDLNDIIVDSY